MDMRIAYVNHLGERVDLGPAEEYHYKRHGLYDAELAYDAESGYVGALRREPREYELPVAIEAKSEEAGLAARERLHAVLDADMLSGSPGRVEVGGYAMRAVPVRVARDHWWISDMLLEATVTLLAEDPVWTRELRWEWVPDRSPEAQAGSLDYPMGYPRDYSPNPAVREVDVDAPGPCPWRITVYGPAVDPYVVIGGNRHQVLASVPDGGLLVADSRDLSIVVRDVDGNETDAFDARIRGAEGSGEDMWAPLQPGTSAVSWSNAFGWDLAAYVERSAPPCA